MAPRLLFHIPHLVSPTPSDGQSITNMNILKIIKAESEMGLQKMQLQKMNFSANQFGFIFI